MPQRFLRPGIRSSKRFNRVTWFEQIFYVRLITLVDDYGRYEADPELLQSEAFPFGTPDGKQVQLSAIVSGLASLAGKDLLTKFSRQKQNCLAGTPNAAEGKTRNAQRAIAQRKMCLACWQPQP